ncbi:sigma-54 interaction domain-containing protein [Sutcliffiella cohnii]|uniref:sigma-54 interaction domain-containing protein n=1 Tax=Sutcliffiella cohnii TaxID=33932 RepID=UPI00399D6157
MKLSGIEALSNDMMKHLLSCIDEAIHAVDENGITIFYNEVAAKHDGLKTEEVIGKHILKVFPSLTEETSTLLKVLKTKKAIFHQDQKYENKNGELIETVNTTIPILIGEEVKGAVEIAKNYGKIKMLSNKLIDLQSRLYKKKTSTSSLDSSYTFQHFLTSDPICLRTLEEAKKVATSTIPIVIYGETGTGKEIVAQGIHNASYRKDMPFIAQNCAAIPETLLESALFGTEKGSYTGAEDRPGLFELANGGTLFLDELNSMPISLQSKLLRVLEDGKIRRIGGTQTITVDVRIVAAMNESPDSCLQKGIIRTDFFYRVCSCSLYLPPLRNRVGDIPLLVNNFIEILSKQQNINRYKVAESVLTSFTRYDWPGNVRELKNTLEYITITNDSNVITVEDLPLKLQPVRLVKQRKGREEQPSLREILAHKEKELITDALQETKGNIVQAAKLLKIPRQTLQYKLSKMEKSLNVTIDK